MIKNGMLNINLNRYMTPRLYRPLRKYHSSQIILEKAKQRYLSVGILPMNNIRSELSTSRNSKQRQNRRGEKVLEPDCTLEANYSRYYDLLYIRIGNRSVEKVSHFQFKFNMSSLYSTCFFMCTYSTCLVLHSCVLLLQFAFF